MQKIESETGLVKITLEIGRFDGAVCSREVRCIDPVKGVEYQDPHTDSIGYVPLRLFYPESIFKLVVSSQNETPVESLEDLLKFINNESRKNPVKPPLPDGCVGFSRRAF